VSAIWLPAALTVARVDCAYTAAAGTNQNFTILSAPGTGKRSRIWRLDVAFGDTSQTPTKWSAVLRDPTTAEYIISGDSFRSQPLWFPGGWTLPGNTSFVVGLASAVTPLAFRVSCGLTVEDT